MLIRFRPQHGLQRPPKARAHSQVYRKEQRSGVRSGRGSGVVRKSQEKEASCRMSSRGSTWGQLTWPAEPDTCRYAHNSGEGLMCRAHRNGESAGDVGNACTAISSSFASSLRRMRGGSMTCGMGDVCPPTCTAVATATAGDGACSTIATCAPGGGTGDVRRTREPRGSASPSQRRPVALHRELAATIETCAVCVMHGGRRAGSQTLWRAGGRCGGCLSTSVPRVEHVAACICGGGG